MARNRNWTLTLNNPTDDERALLMAIPPGLVKYLIATDEVGESGTPHIQAYVSFHNAKTLTAVKKLLGSDRWHLERRRGSHYEAAAYCWKENEPFFEIGDRPVDEAPLNQWEDIRSMIDAGANEYEIAWKYPGTYAKACTGIQRMIGLRDQQRMNEWRDVNVTYLWGDPGVGKTRSVIDKHGADVYRVSNYKNPFDGYRGQPVILFEEFRSSLPIEDMLIYLDGYICTLPSRYADKVGTYTEVYLATNIPLDEQYPNMQVSQPATYAALLRRIDTIAQLHRAL